MSTSQQEIFVPVATAFVPGAVAILSSNEAPPKKARRESSNQTLLHSNLETPQVSHASSEPVFTWPNAAIQRQPPSSSGSNSSHPRLLSSTSDHIDAWDSHWHAVVLVTQTLVTMIFPLKTLILY